MIKIREKFLQLTSNRTPKGTEKSVIKLMPEFKFKKDEFDNYFYIIKNPNGTFSNTMFTAHLDTIDRGPLTGGYRSWNTTTLKWEYKNFNDDKVDDSKKLIKHVFDGDFIKTDGNTNLGADDKAGVVIMLNLMSENVPGLYYFFMGEESGCVGSSSLSRVYESKVTNGLLPTVNKCVSFDRRGYDSVITEQTGGVCCSDSFAKELSIRLNEYGFWYKPDSTGVYTDSAEFMDIIPECTNLSVGYFNEHTTSEKQDIEFLELLSLVLTKIDWETLPIERVVSSISYKGKKSSYGVYSGYGRYSGGGTNYTDYDEYGSEYNYNAHRLNSTKPTTQYKNSNTYIDNGSGKLEKINSDDEFDKWYNEQKSKIPVN